MQKKFNNLSLVIDLFVYYYVVKEKFIPGIDNYCDRWCERCAFTSRCHNFENTSKSSADEVDINNTALWEHVTENFQKTIQLLHQTAKEKGIDLDSSLAKQESDTYEKRRIALKKAVKNHLLSKLCNQYQEIVMPVVKKPKELDDKEQELKNDVRLGIKTNKEAKTIVNDIDDSLDIIQWYLFFIGAKLQRALNGKLEGEYSGVDGHFQKDSEGSAKVTLIAIEKSIEAWSKLYEFIPSLEDEILPALSLLAQLKKKTFEEFPQAMEFKRPGFDD